MYPDNQQDPQTPPNTPPQQPTQPQPAAPVTPPSQPTFSAAPTPTPVQPAPQFTTAPDQMGMPSPQGAPKPGGNKTPLIILAAVLVVGAIAVAAYFLWPKQNSANQTGTAQSTASSAQTVDMTELKSAKINGPDMSGYTLTLDSPTSKQYAKGDCNIVFGTTNAIELPGSTYDDIIAKKVAAYPAQGINATPSTGTDLLLKDATNSNKQYSLRTTVFTATSGSTHLLANYSIAILGDGSRAFVTRACRSTSGAVQASAMNEIESKARGMTVTPQ